MQVTSKKMTDKNVDVSEVEVSEFEQKIAELEEKLELAQLKEQRALADYQNLVRRTQQDMLRRSKLAAKDFVTSLLQPLEHLHLAAEQLNDPGLHMVVGELWKNLDEQGLTKIECLGKPFDLDYMEAVEKAGKGEKVTKVVRNGYELNGETVQVARVILD